MIRSFAHKGLERFYLTGSAAGIQVKHGDRLRLILAALAAAESIAGLRLPGLNLHQLRGDRKDIWAVTVQANWRVTFRFINGYAEIVNYEDYH